MQSLRKIIIYSLIFLLPQIGLWEIANATIVTTDQLMSAMDRQAMQSKVQRALSRPEVARQLESMGVAPEQAQSRVAALTDDELARLADQTDRLPAGGDFFGTVGLIFIILLITDLLGLTKVFPFTRAQR